MTDFCYAIENEGVVSYFVSQLPKYALHVAALQDARLPYKRKKIRHGISRLGSFLQDNDLTEASFAVLVLRDPSTVWRWARGKSQPDWPGREAILRVTGGAVTPNDFLPNSAPSPAADLHPYDVESSR
jgi:hypothetical protein